jgi:hypothetical protein
MAVARVRHSSGSTFVNTNKQSLQCDDTLSIRPPPAADLRGDDEKDLSIDHSQPPTIVHGRSGIQSDAAESADGDLEEKGVSVREPSESSASQASASTTSTRASRVSKRARKE